MKRLYVDFNSGLEDGRIILDSVGSRESIAGLEKPLEVGEKVALTDGDVEVDAVVERYVAGPRNVWVAVLDKHTWKESKEGNR